MNVDVSFLPALGAAFMLTFARIGTMVMLLPGVGELSMPSRVRLGIALVLTGILLPSHQNAYAIDLNSLGPVIVMLFQEIIIGAVLGLTARLATSALAGGRLGGRAAARPRFRHRRRSDAEPAGHAGRQFPQHRRRHAGVRHRPASSGDRRR